MDDLSVLSSGITKLNPVPQRAGFFFVRRSVRQPSAGNRGDRPDPAVRQWNWRSGCKIMCRRQPHVVTRLRFSPGRDGSAGTALTHCDKFQDAPMIVVAQPRFRNSYDRPGAIASTCAWEETKAITDRQYCFRRSARTLWVPLSTSAVAYWPT